MMERMLRTRVNSATILEALASLTIIIGALMFALPLLGTMLKKGDSMQRAEAMLRAACASSESGPIPGPGTVPSVHCVTMPHGDLPGVWIRSVILRTPKGEGLILERTIELDGYVAY